MVKKTTSLCLGGNVPTVQEMTFRHQMKDGLNRQVDEVGLDGVGLGWVS